MGFYVMGTAVRAGRGCTIPVAEKAAPAWHLDLRPMRAATRGSADTHNLPPNSRCTCCVRVFRSALSTIFSQASADGSCTCFRARSPTQMSSSRLRICAEPGLCQVRHEDSV